MENIKTLETVKTNTAGEIIYIYREQYYNEEYRKLEKKYHTPIRSTKIERNSLCPCGSGLKYKKCCINKKSD